MKIKSIALMMALSFPAVSSEVSLEGYSGLNQINEIQDINDNIKEVINRDLKSGSEIKYNISKSEDGYFYLNDGLYKNQNGEIEFDIKIKDNLMLKSVDYLDLIEYSKKFNIKSNSISKNDFFSFLDDIELFNENYHILKNEDRYFVKNLSFETLDYKFEFKGELVLIHNSMLIKNGSYRINNTEGYIEGQTLDYFISYIIKDFLKELVKKTN